MILIKTEMRKVDILESDNKRLVADEDRGRPTDRRHFERFATRKTKFAHT